MVFGHRPLLQGSHASIKCNHCSGWRCITSTRNLPLTVLVVSCIFIAAGAVGFVYHFPQLLAHRNDSIWIEFVRLLAVLAGTFMLLGRNWARWLAVAWLAFHVIISFPVVGQIVMHSLLLALITYALFRSEANSYFRSKSQMQ